jgi:hypothetical protein
MLSLHFILPALGCQLSVLVLLKVRFLPLLDDGFSYKLCAGGVGDYIFCHNFLVV